MGQHRFERGKTRCSKMVQHRFKMGAPFWNSKMVQHHFKTGQIPKWGTTARLLNPIYVVPVPPPGYVYNNFYANVMDEPTPSTSACATASVPPFSFTA